MGMEETQLGILLAGLSSILGVLVYFTKNIKEMSAAVRAANNVPQTVAAPKYALVPLSSNEQKDADLG
jgi:hypothetical protein